MKKVYTWGIVLLLVMVPMFLLWFPCFGWDQIANQVTPVNGEILIPPKGLGAERAPGEVEAILNAEKNNLKPMAETIDLKQYCMRDEYVIYTQDQEANGLCWDFASSTALATTIMKATGQYYDFSETWVSLARAHEYASYQFGSGGNFYNFDDAVSKYGILLDSDLTYDQSFMINEYDLELYFNFYQQFANKTIRKNLTTTSFLGNTNAVRQQLKNHVYRHGSLYIAMDWGDLIYNGDYSYKKPDSHQENDGSHAVSLIGWDDNVTITIDDTVYTGAWLCLNSWGDTYNQGMFYVMYNDPDVFPVFYGYKYLPSTSDLYYHNYIADGSGYTSYYTNLAERYYTPYRRAKRLTKQQNIYYDDDVNLRFCYDLSTGASVKNIQIFHGTADVTKLFDQDALNPDNKDFTLMANDLACGTYKVIVTYGTSTQTSTYTNVFYVMDEGEFGTIYLSGNTDSNLALGSNLHNGYYMIHNSYNYSAIEITVMVNQHVNLDLAYAKFNLYSAAYTESPGAYHYVTFYVRNGLEQSYILPGKKQRQLKVNFVMINVNNQNLVTMHYNLNGGTFNGNPRSRLAVNNITGCDLPIPTKDGYMFAGWYTDANLTNKLTDQHLGSSNIAKFGTTADVYAVGMFEEYYANAQTAFVYAKWQVNPIVVISGDSNEINIADSIRFYANIQNLANFGSELVYQSTTWYRNGIKLNAFTNSILEQTLGTIGEFEFQAEINVTYYGIPYSLSTDVFNVLVKFSSVDINYVNGSFVWDNYGLDCVFVGHLFNERGQVLEFRTNDTNYDLFANATASGEYYLQLYTLSDNKLVGTSQPITLYQVTYHYFLGDYTLRFVDPDTPIPLVFDFPTGYDFHGWYYDQDYTEAYTADYATQDTDLYAKLTLQEINLTSIDNIEQTYNGEAQTVTITPSHSGGFTKYSYQWYVIKNFLPLEVDNTSNTLTVKTVNDSGLYYAVVTLRDNFGNVTTKNTNQFSVKITPLAVKINSVYVPAVYTYNGTVQTITRNAYCTVNGEVVDDVPLNYTIVEDQYLVGDFQFRDVPAEGRLTMLISLADTENYEAENAKVILNIYRPLVTIKVSDQTGYIFMPLNKLQYEMVGTVYGDDEITVELLTDADVTNPGTYNITAQVSDNPNYEIQIVNGTYTLSGLLVYCFIGSFAGTILVAVFSYLIIHNLRKK